MKIMQSLVLAAIVLGTSACASNAVKHQPTAARIDAPSTLGTLVGAPIDVPEPSTSVAHLPGEAIDGYEGKSAIAVAGVDHKATLPEAAVQDTADNANSLEAAVQTEQDVEALYAKPPVRDPWERFNRKMHSVNTVLDRFVFRPVAVGYDKVVPDPVQSGVSRFFANLRLPVTAVNQALQGHPGHAGQSLGRFVVNTTVGVAGVFDPATRFGVPKRDGEDFGQTLATWGWQDSRYFVMPLLGPRTVRDSIGIVGDIPLSPIGQIDSAGLADKLQILQVIDGRAQMLPLDEVRKEALDDYVFVRDAWAQRRNRQIEKDLNSNRD